MKTEIIFNSPVGVGLEDRGQRENSFSPSLGVRAEWERYQKVGKPFEIGGTGTTGEADTDFYSVSLVYRF